MDEEKWNKMQMQYLDLSKAGIEVSEHLKAGALSCEMRHFT